MKSTFKTSLLAVAVISAIGLLLWMRELASWRPVKIAKLPPGTSIFFLSSDAKTALLDRNGKPPMIWDVASGRQLKWPYSNSLAHPIFSPSEPNWAFTLKLAKDMSVEVRDLATGHLKRTFRWPKTQFKSHIISDSDGNRIGIVEGGVFRQWNIGTGQQIHERTFDIKGFPTDSAFYAVSPNGKRLIGCADSRGVMWDTASGKRLHSWKVSSYGQPVFFSNDASVIAYTSSDPFITFAFVDTATGKMKWQTSEKNYLHYETGDELVFSDDSGCDILDVQTGRPKRHLSGPRKSAYQIQRATPDFIYTLNDNDEILRWRAH